MIIDGPARREDQPTTPTTTTSTIISTISKYHQVSIIMSTIIATIITTSTIITTISKYCYNYRCYY